MPGASQHIKTSNSPCRRSSTSTRSRHPSVASRRIKTNHPHGEVHAPSVETERQKVTKDEGISGLPKQNNPTTLPGHVDPRTHEGKLFNSWRFSGDGSCHEETPFSPGSTSTCHARSQGNLAHSTRSRRNKRLNGKQDTTKVLRASPNPAAHGVGTTSPRQGRLKPTTRRV